MRMRVGGSTLIAIALAAQFQALRAEWTTTNQAKSAQPCRIGATTSKTRMEAQKGFWAESMSTCRFDKATSKSTCTNEYVDSVGTKATTVSVTTFASVADAIDEVKIIPPLRLSTTIETKASGPKLDSTTVVANSYDDERRLVKEDVTVTTARPYSTTYKSWDKYGRPTAGTTIFATAPPTALEMVYDDATRTVTTTSGAGEFRLVCALTYDANGNPASTECHSPGGAPGSTSRSTTATMGTERICR